MRQRIALDNSRINAMALRPDLLREFPFLSLQTKQRDCCGKSNSLRPDHDAIRRAVLSLPPERQAKLKELLKVQQITVYIRDGNLTRTETI